MEQLIFEGIAGAIVWRVLTTFVIPGLIAWVSLLLLRRPPPQNPEARKRMRTQIIVAFIVSAIIILLTSSWITPSLPAWSVTMDLTPTSTEEPPPTITLVIDVILPTATFTCTPTHTPTSTPTNTPTPTHTPTPTDTPPPTVTPTPTPTPPCFGKAYHFQRLYNGKEFDLSKGVIVRAFVKNPLLYYDYEIAYAPGKDFNEPLRCWTGRVSGRKSVPSDGKIVERWEPPREGEYSLRLILWYKGDEGIEQHVEAIECAVWINVRSE